MTGSFVSSRAASAVSFAILALALTHGAAAQLRIVNYNIADLHGDLTALQGVIEAIHDDDKPGFAVPVSLFVFQEVHSPDFAPLQNIINNAAPPGVTYLAGTYTNNNEDNYAGAQAMFYRQGTLSEETASHIDIYTQAGRYSDRWRMHLIGYDSLDSWFYIYSSHLKASQGAANEAERLQGVQALRANADALPVGTNIIFAGDMNFYTNTESGYQWFISAGNAQAVDALGTGSWAGSINAIKHSQSPLLTSVNGLVGGGMNDRFDHQFATNAWHDGGGLDLMSGVPHEYRSLGNDGMHYNLAIDTGNNFYYPGDLPRSNALAKNLRLASDHLPVVVDYQIPAIMIATITPDYGRVIQNALFAVQINVTNTADVVIVEGADQLNYTANASDGLSGRFSDFVDPMGDVSSPSFPLDTSVAGPRGGSVLVTSPSQAVQNPSITLNTAGTIVRHSNASFSDSVDVNELTVPLSLDPDSGVHPIDVDVHNLGFDSLQALLDIDSLDSVSPPYAFVGGALSGIGLSPATLQFTFDTFGLKPGVYEAPVAINTSDENLPGETTATINLTISVTIGNPPQCVADITGDQIVNAADLLAVINAWGICPPGPCAADTNSDGVVNAADLLTVINAWGACP